MSYFDCSFLSCVEFGARNILTYHAEDGSGVGSAIIAGM